MATVAKQQYHGDDKSIIKVERTMEVEPGIIEKISTIQEGAEKNKIQTIKVNGKTVPVSPDDRSVDITVPHVIDDVYSTSEVDALSANMGRALSEEIMHLKSIGRFLSLWSCELGMPTTQPPQGVYKYKTGDYFIITRVAGEGGTNYRPEGEQYTQGDISQTIETEEVKEGDTYFYDGENWTLQVNTSKEISVDDKLSLSSENPVQNKIITAKVNEVSQSIPTLVSQLENDAEYITLEDVPETANTKTFVLEGIFDKEGAQAILDYILEGKYAVVRLGDGMYHYASNENGVLIFVNDEVGTAQTASVSNIVQTRLTINHENNVVTTITLGNNQRAYVLETNKNYSNPYTPQYAGSPATKKYVDDTISTELTDYVTTTDYATSSVGGVVKVSEAYGTEVSGGVLKGKTLTYADADEGAIVSKGTLNNALSTYATKDDLATKQDVIEDLQDIRDGASKGYTALQPNASADELIEGNTHLFLTSDERTKLSNTSGVNTGDETLESIKTKLGVSGTTTDGYLTKEDYAKFNNKQAYIEDLEAIRSGANKGATALQEETDPVFTNSPAGSITQGNITSWNSKQDAITDLATIRSGAAKGATALQTETDPIFNASPAKNITNEEITKWNSTTSANDATIEIHNAITGKVGEFTLNQSGDKTITIPLGQANKPGLVAGGNWLTINQTTGKMEAGELTKAQYDSADGKIFIGKTTLNNVLVSKQDVISDLATIRDGASKGATALQSYTETDPTVPSHVKSITSGDISNWNSKQASIEDLATIRAGASKGATALQKETDPVFTASPAGGIKATDITNWNSKQNVISDLETIRSGAALGATALQEYTETDPIFNASPAKGIKTTDINNWNNKQNAISDLSTIRAGAALGMTALQEYTETDPLYTADKPNIALKSEIPDISGKLDKDQYVGGVNLTPGLTFKTKITGFGDLGNNEIGDNSQYQTTLLNSGVSHWSSSGTSGMKVFIKFDKPTKTSAVSLNFASTSTYGKPTFTVSGGNSESGLTQLTTGNVAGDGLTQYLYDEVEYQYYLIDIPHNNWIDLRFVYILNSQDGILTYGDYIEFKNKQNEIADLNTIRSGASLGATAVQPSTLNSFATLVDLSNGLKNKQDKALVTTLANADNEHYPSAKAVADAMSGAGFGDMLKSTYDPNNVGKNAFDYNNFINTPEIVDNVTTNDATKVLSAKQGKELQDEIDTLKALGHFLSNWNATTGQPVSFPLTTPYTYVTGDYFIVTVVGSNNKKPTGTSYTGTASTVAESEELAIGDVYTYDGQIWLLQVNHGKTVSFSNLSGQPSDNANLATALNSKQPLISDLDSIRTNANTGATAKTTIDDHVKNGTIHVTASDKIARSQKQPLIEDLDTIRSNATLGATALQPGTTSDDIEQGTTNLFLTSSEREKLDNTTGINTGDETASSIKTKLGITTLSGSNTGDETTNSIKTKLGTASATTDGYLQASDYVKFNGKQDSISDLATIRNNAEKATTAVQPGDLADVATSGDYEDLINKPSTPYFILKETTDYTVAYDDTKGVAPYNTSYGYTNVTITKPGVEWIEGAFYFFAVNTLPGTSTYRNIRVRIGESGEWIGLGSPSSVSAGYSYFTKAYAGTFVYNKKYYDTGALHSAFYDSNTTYAYLVNTWAAGNVAIDSAGYGARYSLIFPTTPIGSTAPKYSSLVKSSATGATKACPTIKFYADRHTQYIYSANIAAGAVSAQATYQNYTTHDLRYTHNYAATNFSANQRVFLWLEKFNPENYSFETSNSTNHMMTEDKISSVFPSTTSGDIYLWYLGQNTATLYTCQPDFEAMYRIYKYTPSTGAMTPFGASGDLDKKQDVITDLDTIRSGAAKGATALQSYTETDPVFKASPAGGITQANINTWNGKQDSISDLATIRDGASKGATALQSYTETDPVFSASAASGITSTDISNWNGKQSAISDLATIRSGAALGATALQSFTETDPTVPAHVKAITQTNINNWNAKGTYSKPSGGIPSTDLSSAVQSSLVLADSALQTETDPTVPSHVKSITQSNITSWNNKLNTPSGGTEGQVLTKTSTGTAWQDAAKGGSSMDVMLQTAYDNLSDADKMDGTFRFIYIEQES